MLVDDMRNVFHSSDERGFTLLELLITMGILLIVVTAAYQG